MKDLFKKHIDKQVTYIQSLLEKKGLDSLVIDTGLPPYYYQDDQTIPFRPNPLFLHLCPDSGPGHILQVKKTGKPILSFFSPDDFWHEVSSFGDSFWSNHFEVKIINSEKELWKSIDTLSGKHICLTPQPEKAAANNIPLADNTFLSALHWSRIQKTDYEIQCLREANKIASLGHLAAKESFFQGKSERETFQNYLIASNQFQLDLPYGNIIAFNEKAAILHYQNSRDFKNGHSFLIDAGARFNGYCSDITRTYYTEKAHPVFKSLHATIEASQIKLCSMVSPGVDYEDIQDQAHIDITQSLIDNDIILNSSLESALDHDLASTFYPHGVGHGLGLQVHDVGGKQIDDEGTPSPKSKKHPYLRTLREIQPNDVLTIEPGLYFIPMLLKQLKEDATKKDFINWNLVEELLPFGGIRIEDNIVARAGSEPENLTRPFLPN